MNSSVPYLDTNCVLRAMLGDVPEQAEAVRQLLASQDRMRIIDPCLIECVFVLAHHYRLNRNQIYIGVSRFLASDHIACPESTYLQALESWRDHPRLSFEDCLLAAKADTDSTVLYTFDKNLTKDLPVAQLVS